MFFFYMSVQVAFVRIAFSTSVLGIRHFKKFNFKLDLKSLNTSGLVKLRSYIVKAVSFSSIYSKVCTRNSTYTF